MHRVPLNDLSRIGADTAANILRSIADVIDRGAFLKGPFTAELEQRLSHRLSGRPVLGVANGTDALYLALRAIGVSRGHRVATVANAGGYASGAALNIGAQPVFVDVDSRTAQMSSESLAQVLTDQPDVAAVVLTHLYGMTGDVHEIAALCSSHGVALVEDCAQSMGAVVGGRPAGTFGQVATTSFYPTKNLGAYGDGGAVISSTPALHELVTQLAQYGWGSRYEVVVPGGINSRIDEMQSAVLLEVETALDTHNERRRSIVARYAAALTGSRYMIGEHSERFVGHLAVMVTEDRVADASALNAAGVGTGVHYPILDHRQQGWAGLVPHAQLPSTEWLVERILTVPCFPTMTDAEVEQVASAIGAL